MDNNSKYPRILSIFILISISIIFLVLALWPTISVLLMDPQEQASIEIEGIFIFALQVLIPFPCFLLAIGVYKFLEKFLKLYKLSVGLVPAVAGMLILPATLSFPVLWAANQIDAKITSSKINVSLLNEQINMVQNMIGTSEACFGTNPYLYEYKYELKIDNRAGRTHVVRTGISLGWDVSDKQWKWDKMSACSENWLYELSLKPGENIISGKFPIIFNGSEKTPNSSPVQLQVYIERIDGTSVFKSLKLKSSLDWIKIYGEQQNFAKEELFKRQQINLNY